MCDFSFMVLVLIGLASAGTIYDEYLTHKGQSFKGLEIVKELSPLIPLSLEDEKSQVYIQSTLVPTEDPDTSSSEETIMDREKRQTHAQRKISKKSY